MAFELFCHERFVPGDEYLQALFARLGPPPAGMSDGQQVEQGRRRRDIWLVHELVAPAMPWSQVLQARGAFAWRCEERPSAAALLTERDPLHHGEMAGPAVPAEPAREGPPSLERTSLQVPALLVEALLLGPWRPLEAPCLPPAPRLYRLS